MSPKVAAVQGEVAGFLCPVETALKMAQLAALGLVVYLVALVGVQIMVLVGILVAAPELTLAAKLSDIVAVELLVVEIPLAVAAVLVVVVVVVVVVARVAAVVTAIPTSTTSSTKSVAVVVMFVVANVFLVTVLVNMAVLDVDITSAAKVVMVVVGEGGVGGRVREQGLAEPEGALPYESLGLKALQECCTSRNIAHSGNKSALIQRLQDKDAG